MSLFRDADPRFRGLNIKVAVFVALAAIAGVALLLTQAWQQGYFTTKTTLRVEAPTGVDLRPGMAVKLSGFKIGSVSRVELNESARVDVDMRIEDQYMKWIKADSRVSVTREGLIGDSYLSVSSGSPELTSLGEGEAVVFDVTPGLADLAQDIRNRILPVISGTTTLLDYLNDPKGDFRLAVADLRKLSGDLHETRKRVDTLLASVDTVAREDVRKTLTTLQTEIQSISARTDQSLAKIDEATVSAKSTSDEARKTAEAARKAFEESTPRMNRLLDDADSAVQESRQLIDGASKRWIFRGGEMPKEAPPAGTAAGP